jgi:nucleotide-binding universal stress UspA family protein
LSGGDVEVWVVHVRGLGEAVLAAVEHRDKPLICAGVRTSRGILKRKVALDLVVAQALVHAPAPVLVIGPEVDVTRGLPLQELVVSLDGSPESELVLPLAVQWATAFELPLTLVGVTRVPAEEATAERRYLSDRLAQIAGEVPEATYRLIEGSEPGAAICAHLAERPESVMMMSTHGRSGLDDDPLGSVAQSVLVHSVRPVVFRRAVPPEAWAPKPDRDVWLNLPD